MINENKLLCICSAVTLDSANVDILNEIVNNDVDWAYIVEFATIHRVFPLLYRNLKTYCFTQVPPSVLQQLKILCLNNATRNLRLLATLFSVVDVLKRNDIDVLVFKGPVFAADIYGDIGLRSFGDIDLLVSGRDLHQAILLLQNEGFKMDIDLNIEQYEKLVEKSHHAVMIKNGAVIEVHWELSGRYFSKPVRFENLVDRSEDVDVVGRRVRTFGSEDLLIYLCVHGCRHYWIQLEFVACINELIKKKIKISWERVLANAQDQGSTKMLLFGVYLAHCVFGLKLPAVVGLEIKKYPNLKTMADWVMHRMLEGPEGKSQPGYWQSLKYHFTIMDTTVDWVRYILRPIFNPTHSDWQWLKVPASLSILHYLFRPVRLLLKYSREIFGSKE